MLNAKVSTRWNAARPSSIQATMPRSPGVSTRPAADLTTSVALATAMPICAWRSAGGAVAAHADSMPLTLECLNEAELVLGENTGINGVITWTHTVRDLAGCTTPARLGQWRAQPWRPPRRCLP